MNAQQLYTSYDLGLITDARLRRVILDTWKRSLWPCRLLSRARWLELFRAAGYVSNYSAPKPDGAIQVYRAQATEVVGLAWTTDLETAQRYHSNNVRLGFGAPRLLARLVEPSAVLATLVDDSEIVIDPTVKAVSK